MKRLAGLILVVVLVVTVLPVSWGRVKAASVASGTCGAKVSWEVTDDGVLTISGTGAMYDYSYNQNTEAPWNDLKSDITKVVVKQGVTSIGSYAFHYQTKTTIVTLPSTITSIGEAAFTSTGITTIKLPPALTSIGYFAFSRCAELKSITIPDSVAEIKDNAFQFCTALTSIVVPGSVTYGSDVFYSCSGLVNVAFGSGMTKIPAGIFRDCTGLTNIVIPQGVTSIGYSAFQNCRQLRQISIPKSVKTVENHAFYGCYALTEVDYGGSRNDWNNIGFGDFYGDYNDPIYAATVYYNSYNPFTDMSAGAWYFNSVLWAYNQGVTAGTTATTFEPNKTCTRAEFVTFLYKFVGKPWKAAWASECSFSDVKTSDWYYRAVVWANHAGVTHGTGDGKFSPNTTLDRGMIISFLYNMEKYQNGSPQITLTGTKFTDVSSDKYYYRPVLWAEQYKITNGTSATTFSPDKKCTRAEAVTFLFNINKYWNS